MITEIQFDSNYAIFELPSYSDGAVYIYAVSFDSWSVSGTTTVAVSESITIF